MRPLPAARRTATTASARPAVPTDFDRSPFLVIWEATRACALACLHCRADAIPRRDPAELSTAEALRLIDDVRAFGNPPPLFVLTGGDPMRRPDLPALVRHASTIGLTVALTPSGTAAVTRARLAELKDAGLQRLAVSLDGPTAESHDAFRGVRGSFSWTMRIIEDAAALGLTLQINSTVSRRTYPHLHEMAARVSELPIVLWAVFFLIQTGRGAALEQITSHECEAVLRWLEQLSREVPFGIKTTEAPHYHRVVQQAPPRGPETGGALRPSGRAQLRAPRSVSDGNGFVFVDHVGTICPSGFLPVSCGDVRRHSLVDVYRDDPLFLQLRNPDALEGKCGWCEFRAVCGGSRARAFAATGSPMASDPLCAYQPAAGPTTRTA